ncbi:LOW QUALITY PROTEIN: uncharacterized protein LOC125777905 [Bactrocera dorsalis]|uniref:LOW QUALITY PROTEIN: uncharacterized protein LOC125777905 n=1 Tax=Bactrocera dorsalis TaxID=27457 RepID=A0ABM3JLP0_BACDO|nr:LOW QUALITY PROTEIN: uncharacterized protein LOC125777905 [Bactrocera dorsalis]
MENLKSLNCLHRLDVSQNQLQTIYSTETSVNRAPRLLTNFRYNYKCMSFALADGLKYIIKVQPENYNGGKMNSTVINFSGNRLREFTLDWLVEANISCPYEINLEHNQIENIFALQNFFSATADCAPEIKMTGNPIVCDCKLAWTYSENYRSLFNGLQCVQTSTKLVKDLAQLERKELCAWEPVMCPSECKCYTQFEFLHINCKGAQHIEQLPRPEQVGLKSSVLDISNNNFIVLPLNTTFGYGNVSQLNASYNKITSINISQLPTNLTVLDLRNNRLKSLNDEFLRTYLNESTKLQFLYLSENPWICNCSELQFLYTIRTHRTRIPDADQLLCVNQPNDTLLISNVRELCPTPVTVEYYQYLNTTLISVWLTIIISLCIIALFYKYKLEVRVWLYNHNILRCCIRECELDKHKTFDAFISYLTRMQTSSTIHCCRDSNSANHHFVYARTNAIGWLALIYPNKSSNRWNSRVGRSLCSRSTSSSRIGRAWSFAQRINVLHLQLIIKSNRNEIGEAAIISIPTHYKQDQLETLTLSVQGLRNQYTSLQNLTQTFFKNFATLRQLDLAGNNMRTLNANMFAALTQLNSLNLSHNEIRELPENLFAYQRQLFILDLSHNSLTYLTPHLFDQTPWLRQLKLGGNQLHDTTNLMERLKPLRYLHRLDVSQNQLQTIWSTETSVNRTPRLLTNFLYSYKGMTLDLAASIKYIIKLQPDIYEGGKINSTVINLSGNRLREFTLDWLVAGNISCPFEINLEHNLIENIFALQNFFSATADCVPEIKMTGNPIVCDCKLAWIYSENYRSLFNSLQCVQTSTKLVKDLAQLERNELCAWEPVMCPSECNCYTQFEFLHISCKGVQHIEQLPRPEQVGLKSSVLDISNNNFIALPLNTTFGYGNVSQLNASHNKITSINISQLPNNLTVLDLRNNRLKSLNDEFLRTYLNDSSKLQFLYLSENPWFCHCSTQKLLYTIRTHRRRIPDADQLLCVNRPNDTLLMANVRELCPTPVTVEHNQYMIATVISVLLTVIIFLFIIALFYKYKLEVNVWLYSHNILRCCIRECELDKHKTFDAFISYAHQDADFVNHTLLPRLEQCEPPFRVCTHERNWLAGAYIPEQIIESVEQSRRTIIVLSQHFIESDWARMEFRTAHQCSLNEGRARIIMIKYGEISKSELLDRELKAYLDMNTYLDWQDVRFWDKLRYAMPHKVGVERNSDMLKINGRMYVMGQVEVNCLADDINLLETLTLNVQDLRNQYLSLQNLTQTFFKNFTALKHLDLAGNNMRMLDANIFAELTQLNSLNLSRNEIQELPEGMFAYQPQLLILDLSHNSLKYLSPHLFDQTPWLWQLKLGGNQLHDTINLIENLKLLNCLHRLDVSQNQLKTIWSTETSVNRAPSLLTNFRHNYECMSWALADGLNYITELQPENYEGGKINSTVINLSGNRLREFTLDWLVAGNISCPFEINLEHNLIENIFALQNFFIATADCAPEIKITANPIVCDCKLAWIYSENYRSLFNGAQCVQTSTKLVKDLAELERKELCAWEPVMCPSECNCYTQFEFLHINCNGAQHIEQLPRPEQVGLKSSVLDISNNNFIVLPLNTTFGYGNVSQLNASYNKITSINISQLPTNLTVLDLRNNRLNSLNDEFLRTYLNESTKLQFLYLSENPWFCDCSTQKLLYTIRTHRTRIPDADQLLCVNQPNDKLLIANVRELCSIPATVEYNQYLIATLISLGLTVIILLCIIALFYKYKLEVKVWLYNHNILRSCIRECELDKHKTFDAFISMHTRMQTSSTIHCCRDSNSANHHFVYARTNAIGWLALIYPNKSSNRWNSRVERSLCSRSTSSSRIGRAWSFAQRISAH